MTATIKWSREYPNLRGKAADLDILIWATQYGTYTNSKRYEWRVSRNGEPIRYGSEFSQREAKRLAQQVAEETIS